MKLKNIKQITQKIKSLYDKSHEIIKNGKTYNFLNAK